MIYSKGYCDSCDTDNCEHANPLRLGRVDQTPQQAAIVKALDERATLLARVEAAEAERDQYKALAEYRAEQQLQADKLRDPNYRIGDE